MKKCNETCDYFLNESREQVNCKLDLTTAGDQIGPFQKGSKCVYLYLLKKQQIFRKKYEQSQSKPKYARQNNSEMLGEILER